MIALPKGFSLDDLAQREAMDPELDKLTREWALQDADFRAWEVEQCKKDYARLARRWLTIRTPGGPMLLKFKPAQKRLHELVKSLVAGEKPVQVRILKARQEGISTYSQGLQFWMCAVARTHISGMTVAHDVESVQTLLGMSRQFLQALPDFLRPQVKYDTKNHLEFGDRQSDMKLATEKNSRAGRSRTLVFTHGSEVAYWEHAGKTTTSLNEAMPMIPGTFKFEETTGNGPSGYFYERWKDTQTRMDRGEEMPWVNLFIPWTEEPTYRMALFEGEEDDILGSLDREEEMLINVHAVTVEQLKWRRRKIAGGDVELFHQEYPTHWEEAFISTGRAYFDRLVLVGWRKAIEDGPKPLPMPLKTAVSRTRLGVEQTVPIESTLSVFELPQPGVKYVVGADISEGISPNANNTDPDWSVADVGRMDTGDQVAELRGRFDPDVFGALLDALGRMYNEATLVPEAHGLGVSVINALLKLGYPNLYYRASMAGEPQPGWETNLATKPQMLATSKAWVRDKIGTILSLACLNEHMAVEIKANGKVVVAEGHDDCVVARGMRLAVTELVAPVTLAVERSQQGADMMERLRRFNKKCLAENQRETRMERDGSYADEVLGRVS